jgi:alcohol dehydrogenase class IV
MLWTLKKIFYRVYQWVMKGVLRILPFPVPELLTGAGSLETLPEAIRLHGVDDVFVVTDKGLVSAGLVQRLLDTLHENRISYTLYDEVQPNPTIQNVEKGLKLYLTHQCKGIVAFGGGSPMDCAKLIGARVTNPKRSVPAMKGLFKVRRKLPPLFAVPTTAGTGSETTLAAVISDPETHEKFAVVDLKLVPVIAVLDPELMLGLPPHITAATGMDALTHAIEAYIGRYGTKFTNERAEKATRIILEDLEDVYRDGSDLEKRHNMALASFYAGSAFTRAYVGYVHAIAHNMGGLYGVPHGLANAIILPHVLRFSRKEAEQKLARLARAGGIGRESDPDEELSCRFIEKIDTMNRNMSIPTTIKELQEKDIPLIAERALEEGNPDYPVPRLMSRRECEALVRKMLCE